LASVVGELRNAQPGAEASRMVHSETFSVETKGRGTYEITRQIQQIVRNARAERGLCSVFVHHTSASLIVCENADPSVRRDVERFFAKLVPDGHPDFHHTAEGPDDMPAHLRSILTQNSVTIPVATSQCDLGSWQGIYLYEHRRIPHHRRITVSVVE
jgi:secondary thiamine-phosphate synthase enzyme